MKPIIKKFRDMCVRDGKVACTSEAVETLLLEEIEKAHFKGFNEGSDLTGGIATEELAIKLHEQKERLTEQLEIQSFNELTKARKICTKRLAEQIEKSCLENVKVLKDYRIKLDKEWEARMKRILRERTETLRTQLQYTTSDPDTLECINNILNI